jgi:hypothetical protein
MTQNEAAQHDHGTWLARRKPGVIPTDAPAYAWLRDAIWNAADNPERVMVPRDGIEPPTP